MQVARLSSIARTLLLRVGRHASRAAIKASPSEAQRLLVLTVVIGIVCGLVAVAFHESIRIAESFLARVARPENSRFWIAWLLAVPTLGGLVTGPILARYFPDARGSGIPQVKATYAERRGRVRLRDSVAKFVLSTIQIGSGASLGREGPTVQICSGVATALGRLARITPQAQRRLIPVGAAAGVAAAFNAPIAAVTFTIEEIIGKLDDTLLTGVIIAAALAAVIERSILGAHPVFDVAVHHGLDDARSLLLYAILGVAAAFVSILFTDTLLTLRLRFRGMARVPEFARPAIGGFLTGATAVLAILLLKAGGVTGGGYESLRRALSGELEVKVLLGLCLAKLLATCFSYSSGGVGGIFAPVLFIGAMLGGAFGSLDKSLFGHTDQAASAFALVGMGALFSGAIRAPMTSVLIIVEMTSGYELILPLMIANMSSYLIARRFRPQPIYEALLAQDGLNLEGHHLNEELDRFALKDLVAADRPFLSFAPSSPAKEVLRAASAPTWQTVFPVLDEERRIVGVITHAELRSVLTQNELPDETTALDIMRPPATVTTHHTLRIALERMRLEGVRELPVVDDDGRVIGFVDEGALAQIYLASLPPASTRAL